MKPAEILAVMGRSCTRRNLSFDHRNENNRKITMIVKLEKLNGTRYIVGSIISMFVNILFDKINKLIECK